MKRILVALDASPRAPSVLAAAAHLAELTNTTLVLYRAVGVPPDLPKEIFKMTDRSVEEVLMNNALADLERLAKDIPKAHIEKITATFATPWDGICRAAREYVVDMIVIGSHGYGGLDRVLGTTAAKVVNHADRNVLVVRAPL
jgi:nucleotide-binding universal stress UspA family protein